MKVKVVKMFEDVKLPTYATDGSGCFDIYNYGGNAESVFSTGLKFEIPKGYVMLIYSRSGHGFNYNTRLSNCVGVIDSDYRGEVKVKLRQDGNHAQPPCVVMPGQAIAQGMIIPYEQVEWEEADGLSVTGRGEGGFGSTDVSVNTNKGNVNA